MGTPEPSSPDPNEPAVLCGRCGTKLADRLEPNVTYTCPKCGAKHHSVTAAARATTSASAQLTVAMAWDANSLTLAGVIYAILVTVGGVVAAGRGWIWLSIFAVASIGLLGVGLFVAPQRVIAAMRWTLEKGKR